MINTVLGEIDENQLGFTLMHEHLLCSDWVKRMSWPGFINVSAAIKKINAVVMRAKNSGIKTIVDVTPPNLGRDIKVLREVSENTGIQIIACTGSYATEDKWLQRISEDGLLNLYLMDIFEGMQGSASKAGVIKYATDTMGFSDLNMKMLRCAARAHKKSGLPIITHCRPPGLDYGLRQQEELVNEGVNLEKVLIGHFRKGDSLDYAIKVLRKGSYIGLDQMNWQERNLEHNTTVIKKLIDLGWVKQLILSHDAVVCYNFEHWLYKSTDDYDDYAPHMLSYLKEIAWEKMKIAGISEKNLETIFFENPLRLLS